MIRLAQEVVCFLTFSLLTKDESRKSFYADPEGRLDGVLHVSHGKLPFPSDSFKQSTNYIAERRQLSEPRPIFCAEIAN